VSIPVCAQFISRDETCSDFCIIFRATDIDEIYG